MSEDASGNPNAFKAQDKEFILRKDAEGHTIARPFEVFESYYNPQGLSQEEQQQLTSLMVTAYERTGGYWIAALCHDASEQVLGDFAQHPELLPKGLSVQMVTTINHSWIEFLPSDEMQKDIPSRGHIVFDPTGIAPGSLDPEDYTPFFGNPQNAPSYLRETYVDGIGGFRIQRPDNSVIKTTDTHFFPWDDLNSDGTLRMAQ